MRPWNEFRGSMLRGRSGMWSSPAKIARTLVKVGRTVNRTGQRLPPLDKEIKDRRECDEADPGKDGVALGGHWVGLGETEEAVDVGEVEDQRRNKNPEPLGLRLEDQGR